MSNIFDNIELSQTFSQEQLVTELFKRVLGQQAEIKALGGLVMTLLQKQTGLTDDDTAKIIVNLAAFYTEEVFVNDEFLAEAWRDKNNKDLGLD